MSSDECRFPEPDFRPATGPNSGLNLLRQLEGCLAKVTIGALLRANALFDGLNLAESYWSLPWGTADDIADPSPSRMHSCWR